MDIKGHLLLWLTNFLIKKVKDSGFNTHANNCVLIMKNQMKNYSKQLLENLNKELFVQNLQTIFWLQG